MNGSIHIAIVDQPGRDMPVPVIEEMLQWLKRVHAISDYFETVTDEALLLFFRGVQKAVIAERYHTPRNMEGSTMSFSASTHLCRPWLGLMGRIFKTLRRNLIA